MRYNMKYFILMSSFLLFAFSAAAEFNRQEKRPDYFIPEREIVKTPVFFTQPMPQKTVSSGMAAHTGANKNSSTTNKKTPPVGMKEPRFQKIYKEYHNDVLTMKRTGFLPVNEKLRDDLKKMSGDERFEVGD